VSRANSHLPIDNLGEISQLVKRVKGMKPNDLSILSSLKAFSGTILYHVAS
jgi:hypothetical protein